MSKHWYIVQCLSGQEFRAAEFVRKRISAGPFKDRIFDVLVPEERIQEMKNGKKRVYKKKVFPGYLLIEMDFTDENYQLAREIPGVTGFVGFDGQTPPKPLSKSELKNLIVTEEKTKEEAPVQTKIFKVDQQVKIVDGAFKDFIGVVEDVSDEKGRLKVRVEIFGRSTPVDVDFLQVEKI